MKEGEVGDGKRWGGHVPAHRSSGQPQQIDAVPEPQLPDLEVWE